MHHRRAMDIRMHGRVRCARGFIGGQKQPFTNRMRGSRGAGQRAQGLLLVKCSELFEPELREAV